MTKAELVAKIAEEAGLTKSQADNAFSKIVEIVTDEIKNSGSIALTGLGIFSLVKREARKGHNPRTMKPIDIPASQSVKFKCAKALKDALN